MPRPSTGVVAAGHPVTAEAAASILREGGNAFDAALGGLCAACVAEPVLASLGGGGFLLAGPAQGPPLLFDFFAHTPARKRPAGEADFYPIVANFGAAQQQFHIGMGSIAAPGVVRGLFEAHRVLGRMPLDELMAPAVSAAREGVRVNAFQHYIAQVIEPILRSSPGALALYRSGDEAEGLAEAGSEIRRPQLGGVLEALAHEGPDLFYRGEIAERIARDCREGGGHLGAADLEGYRVFRRTPLSRSYRGARIYTNPPPSLGGTLIAFALALLDAEAPAAGAEDPGLRLIRLASVMELIQRLRREEGIDRDLDAAAAARLLAEGRLEPYRRALRKGLISSRGTTQISVGDGAGNLASLTLSNGEGSGYVVPETGIMLNNMLGEEDINPHGFQRWSTGRRLSSMMAPTMLMSPRGDALALGSGGSNRIRSAIVQVLINFLDLDMSVEQAVEAPRIHYEDGVLNMEPGFESRVLQSLEAQFPERRLWPEKNLFFGGAHTVIRNADGTLAGRGDSRRGGVCVGVSSPL